MYSDARDNEAYRRLKVIRQRCTRVRASNFEFYGGKGIECRLPVQEFIAWFKATQPDGSWTIGRKNHAEHYTMDNIEWQPQSFQTSERNGRHGLPKKRGNPVCVTLAGTEHVFAQQGDAAKFLGVCPTEIVLMLAGKYKKPKHYSVRGIDL